MRALLKSSPKKSQKIPFKIIYKIGATGVGSDAGDAHSERS